ncbi:MAG: sugar phosphate isomerase/epimerase family protein [Candidatus Freyarchaeota archaeon]
MTRIKLGISTMPFIKSQFSEIVKVVENAPESLELDCWEIIEEGFHFLNPERIKALKDAASTSKVSFTVHAPFAGINLASPEPLQSVLLDFMDRALERAHALEAEVFITHPGLLSPFTVHFPEIAWKSLINSIKHLAKLSEELGSPKIAVENMAPPYPFLVIKTQDVERLFQELESFSVGLCLDIGHAQKSGGVMEFINNVGQYITHVHAHDNRGEKDAHLQVGKGMVNWETVISSLKELEFNGCIVVENNNLEDAYNSVHYLKTLINS